MTTLVIHTLATVSGSGSVSRVSSLWAARCRAQQVLPGVVAVVVIGVVAIPLVSRLMFYMHWPLSRAPAVVGPGCPFTRYSFTLKFFALVDHPFIAPSICIAHTIAKLLHAEEEEEEEEGRRDWPEN